MLASQTCGQLASRLNSPHPQCVIIGTLCASTTTVTVVVRWSRPIKRALGKSSARLKPLPWPSRWMAGSDFTAGGEDSGSLSTPSVWRSDGRIAPAVGGSSSNGRPQFGQIMEISQFRVYTQPPSRDSLDPLRPVRANVFSCRSRGPGDF